MSVETQITARIKSFAYFTSMYRKMPLIVRDICWFSATIALYLSLGWLIWAIWSISTIDPRTLSELAVPILLMMTFIWIRRYTNRVIRGPIYRFGMQAHVIGQMRHT